MPLMQPDERLTEIREIKADLREEFQETILFRQRTGAKYQTDTRNHRALQLLNKLLNTVDDLPGDLALAYGKVLDEQLDDSALDTHLRAIGFKATFTTAAEFCESYISDPAKFVWKNAIKG